MVKFSYPYNERIVADMKKIALALVFTLLIQGAVFAEGEENAAVPVISEATEVEPEAETAIDAEAETETEASAGAESETVPKSESETAELETEAEAEKEAETETEEESPDNGIKFVDLYVFGNGITLSSYPVFVGDTLMLPIKEYLSHIGANDFSVDSENQITITYGEKIVAMYPDSNKAILNNTEAELPAAPFLSGDTVYAPAESVCKALGFIYIANISGKKMTVYSDIPADSDGVRNSEKRINGLNLSSETPYLIWVNKSEYTVHTFLGEKNNWREVYTCKCAIGAPGSPTVTGTFKYFSRESRWTYDKFYVGPIMRFYGSYAIHSTLLKYDGTDYNNAVGVKNSHGCVRVRPNDLAWLIFYVPLRSTVYVTEK